jgi:hypothetical protein
MPESLIGQLFEGPLDIVGDIHGEIKALNNLLRHLGYDDDGWHPDERRLVFLGDLTDRGPDSPGVVTRVKKLVESGKAQCILGNHDLNILMQSSKHDNHWFFGREFALDGGDEPTAAELADEKIQREVKRFFESLPIALERDDLRVVHACWDAEMIEIARRATDAVALHNAYDSQIKDDLKRRPKLDETDKNLSIQNRNPVKVLTSGKERRAAIPFWASGKLRHEERVPWWEDHHDEPFCVFGHYSMYRSHDRGQSKAFCVDYAVAKRWEERKHPAEGGQFRGMLAAVRIPEKVVVFDNGDMEPIAIPDSKEQGFR